MRDIKSNIKRLSSLAPQSVTAATNGTGIDRFGFESAAVSFNCGAIGGTSPSFTMEVQESDDNSTFTAVAPKDLQNTAPTVTATNAGVTTVGYLGAKRYIRPVVKTVAGTSPTLLVEASVILGHPRNRPAA